MPSSPPKATEVRSSGSGKDGEYFLLLIPARLGSVCSYDRHCSRGEATSESMTFHFIHRILRHYFFGRMTDCQVFYVIFHNRNDYKIKPWRKTIGKISPLLGRIHVCPHDYRSHSITFKNDPAVFTEVLPYHTFLLTPPLLHHGARAPSGPGSPHYLGFTISHTHTHTHTQSVGLIWTNDQPKAQSSTWQHTTLTTDIRVPGEIRTRDPRKRDAAERRFRPRGHWDRRFVSNRLHQFKFKYILIENLDFPST
jgi:hypothetical protein